jgi:hypothetical protein
VAPEARGWATLGGRESVVAWASSGGWRWGTELTPGARLSERRGIGGRCGRREPKGKTYSREDATDARARWAGRAVSACGGNEANGLVGRKAGWAARSVGLKIRKKNFRIKNWIFEFTKALLICRRRFRRNFEVGIFPKFF